MSQRFSGCEVKKKLQLLKKTKQDNDVHDLQSDNKWQKGFIKKGAVLIFRL